MKPDSEVIRVPLSPYGSVRPVRYVTSQGRVLRETLEPYHGEPQRTREQLKILEATRKYQPNPQRFKDRLEVNRFDGTGAAERKT